MPTKPPPERSAGKQTGRWRVRYRLPFHLWPVIEVEVERKEWRPKFSGHTPANWETVTTWITGGPWHEYREEVKR